jgi:hypothetical protein
MPTNKPAIALQRAPAEFSEFSHLRDLFSYECARTDIESMSVLDFPDAAAGTGAWWNTTWWDVNKPGKFDDDERLWLDKAIRYLDICGLIVRHEKKPEFIRILEQPESALEAVAP